MTWCDCILFILSTFYAVFISLFSFRFYYEPFNVTNNKHKNYKSGSVKPKTRKNERNLYTWDIVWNKKRREKNITRTATKKSAREEERDRQRLASKHWSIFVCIVHEGLMQWKICIPDRLKRTEISIRII